MKVFHFISCWFPSINPNNLSLVNQKINQRSNWRFITLCQRRNWPCHWLTIHNQRLRSIKFDRTVHIISCTEFQYTRKHLIVNPSLAFDFRKKQTFWFLRLTSAHFSSFDRPFSPQHSLLSTFSLSLSLPRNSLFSALTVNYGFRNDAIDC